MIPKILSKATRVLIGVGLLVPVLLIGIPAIVAYRAEKEVKSSFTWVTHTLEVERSIQSLVNSIVDAETGQRGFLLTRRDVYLEPYDAGRVQVAQQVRDLRAMTADNDWQQQRLRELDPLIAERMALLAQTIESERQGEHDAALALVNSDRGKFVMDKIRGVLRIMNDEEHRLLWIRQQQLAKQAGRSTMVLWALVAVSAGLTGALLYLLYRVSKLAPIVTMCAHSRTIEYKGEWLSFENYLERRFGMSTSHGMSPGEFERLRGVERV